MLAELPKMLAELPIMLNGCYQKYKWGTKNVKWCYQKMLAARVKLP